MYIFIYTYIYIYIYIPVWPVGHYHCLSASIVHNFYVSYIFYVFNVIKKQIMYYIYLVIK